MLSRLSCISSLYGKFADTWITFTLVLFNTGETFTVTFPNAVIQTLSRQILDRDGLISNR